METPKSVEATGKNPDEAIAKGMPSLKHVIVAKRVKCRRHRCLRGSKPRPAMPQR